MACTWGDTVSSSPWASIRRARNTRSACGEGATENATVLSGAVDPISLAAGCAPTGALLVIVDGAKALDTAVTQTFGPGRRGAAVSSP